MAQQKIYTIQSGQARPIQAGTEAIDGDGKILLPVTKGTGAGSGGSDGDVHIRAAGGSDTGLEIKVNTTWTPLIKQPASFTSAAVARFTATGQLQDGPTIGTGANQLVQLTGAGFLPALNGSLLTAIPDQHSHSNKTTLDGINQGLATTNDVTHRDITATRTLTAGSLVVAAGTVVGNLVQLIDVGGGVAGLPAVDGSNLTNLPTDIIEAPTTVIEIESPSHGFAVGDWIRCTGTNSYTKAQANSLTNSQVTGVVTTVVDSGHFKMTMSGYVDNSAATPDYTASTVLYLSPTTPGAVITTPPTTPGQYVKPLAVITESNTAMVVAILRETFVTAATGGLLSLQFSYLNITSSLTLQEVLIAGSGLTQLPMMLGGYFVGASARLDASITAGTVTLKPTIDGTVVTNTSLDLLLSTGGNPQNVYASVAPSQTGLIFTAGQRIGLKMTTSSGVTPTNMNLVVTLYYTFG